MENQEKLKLIKIVNLFNKIKLTGDYYSLKDYFDAADAAKKLVYRNMRTESDPVSGDGMDTSLAD
jgi:hypothetical protein